MNQQTSVPVLQIRDLSILAAKRNFPAVNDITFDLQPRSSLALVGESGSGKTLTALAIAGLLGDGLISNETRYHYYFIGRALFLLHE